MLYLTDAEVINAAGEDGTVSFDAESFSVYAVVYTVDFHWEVDGKKYDKSTQRHVALYRLVTI